MGRLRVHGFMCTYRFDRLLWSFLHMHNVNQWHHDGLIYHSLLLKIEHNSPLDSIQFLIVESAMIHPRKKKIQLCIINDFSLSLVRPSKGIMPFSRKMDIYNIQQLGFSFENIKPFMTFMSKMVRHGRSLTNAYCSLLSKLQLQQVVGACMLSIELVINGKLESL